MIKKLKKNSTTGVLFFIRGGERNFLIANTIGALKLKQRSKCIVTANYRSW